MKQNYTAPGWIVAGASRTAKAENTRVDVEVADLSEAHGEKTGPVIYNLLDSNSRGVAQPGSAPALGAGGRRFKSYRPDQFSLASSFFIFRNLRTDPFPSCAFGTEFAITELLPVILHLQTNFPVRPVLSFFRYGSQRFDSNIERVRHRQPLSYGLRSGGRKDCGTGARLQRLARLDRVRKLASFFVRERKEAAAAAPTPPPFSRDGDEAGDKGVWMSVSGWQTSTRCTSISWPPDWRSRFSADRYAVERPRDAPFRHPDGHVFRVGRGSKAKRADWLTCWVNSCDWD